jgi:hypothetical protein
LTNISSSWSIQNSPRPSLKKSIITHPQSSFHLRHRFISLFCESPTSRSRAKKNVNLKMFTTPCYIDDDHNDDRFKMLICILMTNKQKQKTGLNVVAKKEEKKKKMFDLLWCDELAGGGSWFGNGLQIPKITQNPLQKSRNLKKIPHAPATTLTFI